MMTSRWLAWMTLAALCLAGTSVSAAVTLAGKVDGLKGNVYATGADGKRRTLKKGLPVFEGDQVQTRRRSLVSIEFKDGTNFSLGADSEMKVNEFIYGQGEEEDTFSASILKGAFRFLTGLVAKEKPDSMNVFLGATATIGIRGTNVGGELEGEMATIVLLDPGVEGQKTAIEVSNEHGAVTIDEPGFGTVVPDANSPPGPVRRMKLRTIDNLMRSIQSISRGLRTPSVGGGAY